MLRFFVVAAALLLASFFSHKNIANAQQPVLSVICPASLIDSKTLANFEKKNKVSLRVELTSGPREFEQRLKNSVNNFDVVIADENELAVLNAARLLRPLPEGRFAEKKTSQLAILSRTQQESKAYINLMADPLGIVWLDDTRTQKSTPTWHELVNPAENPLWRGRIFLPNDTEFQSRLALFASGIASPQTPPENAGAAFEWLRKARIQMRVEGNQLLLELLKKRVVAGALWKSDYLRVRHTVPELNFATPQNTFFRRFGAALVADTLREDMASNFITHLIEHRDDLARFAGITPLYSSGEKEIDTSKWALYDNSIPLGTALEKEFAKHLSKAQ